MGEEEEEKRLSVAEVRKTIASSMAVAFGFVIALVWKEVVLGGLTVAGINMTSGTDLTGWTIFLITTIILTVVMIVFIIIISRWGGKE